MKRTMGQTAHSHGGSEEPRGGATMPPFREPGDSRRSRAWMIGLALALLGVLIAFWRFRAVPKQPEKPLELYLKLAQPTIRAGEQPWYLVQMKNIGVKPVEVHDDFWIRQARLDNNDQYKINTYFEVTGPDGKPMEASFFAEWGFHGEFFKWWNQCDDGKPCGGGSGMLRVIKPGQILTATPTIVAPLRKQSPYGPMTDARVVPPGAPKGYREALDELAKLHADQSEKLGGARPAHDPRQPPSVMHKGYRILEGFHFGRPGRYRIKAIYKPLELEGHPKNREWLRQQLRQGSKDILGLPPETRVFTFESNTVILEVTQ